MASKIRIKIEIDGQKYILPILPPSIQISYPSGNEAANVVKLGEITILKSRRLKTFTIESFFPRRANDYPFCVTRDKFMQPERYISAFERAQNDKLPCIITMEGTGLSAFWATIEDFSITIGRNDDLEYSVSFKEFRPYGQRAKTMQIEATGADGKVLTWDRQGGQRQPAAFAVGDMVIVNGAYWATSTGLYPPTESPIGFGAEPLTSALREVWRNRKVSDGNTLTDQRCVIERVESERARTYDLPALGPVDIPQPIKFRFCVADLSTGSTLGWVSETQMTRIV